MKNLLIASIIALALLTALIITRHQYTLQEQSEAYSSTIDSLQTIITQHHQTIQHQDTIIATNQAQANRHQKYSDSLLKHVSILQHQLQLALNAIDTMPDSAQVAMFNRFTNPAPQQAFLLSYQQNPFVSSPIQRIQNANRIFVSQFLQEQQIQFLKATIISKDSAYSHISIVSAAKDTVIFSQQEIILITGQQFNQCQQQRENDKKNNRRKLIKSSAVTAAITTAIILLLKK